MPLPKLRNITSEYLNFTRLIVQSKILHGLGLQVASQMNY